MADNDSNSRHDDDAPDSGALINANPVVSCHFTLAPDFSVDAAQQAVVEVVKALNKMTGLMLADNKLSIGSSAGQPLLQGIAQLEAFTVIVYQIQQQQLQQARAGIVGAVPSRGPIRMN